MNFVIMYVTGTGNHTKPCFDVLPQPPELEEARPGDCSSRLTISSKNIISNYIIKFQVTT